MVQEHRMAAEAVSLNTVLEYVDQLDIEDQQYLQEIIRHGLMMRNGPPSFAGQDRQEEA